jgi:hypothetical protein
MWACTNCRENVEEQFEACWNCGCSREGKLNLDFVHESTVSGGDCSIEKSFAEHYRCQKCDHREARIERISGRGTGLARIARKDFLAVSCENCGYTDLFNLTILEGRSDMQNILRGLFGG